MTTERRELLEALFDLISEAPAPAAARLQRAFRAYEAKFNRHARRPALLLGLLEQIDDATAWALDEPDECRGHPAGPGDPMGQTVYCDGSCR